MEAIIIVLAAIILALLHHIRRIKEQLGQAYTRVASGEKQVDELESQLNTATDRIERESLRSSGLEDELNVLREVVVEADSRNEALTEQLQNEQHVIKSESKNSAELVSQLKAARREIKQLRNVIAERDEESRLSHVSHGELAEQNMNLRQQLRDAQYALSKETSQRTRATTERRQYRRRFESESLKRSELEEQLQRALREVQRLSKDLRKLKADYKRQGRANSADAQRISELESELADTQRELEHERAKRVGADARLRDSGLAVQRIAELEHLNDIYERRWLTQLDRASKAEAKRKAAEALVEFYIKHPTSQSRNGQKVLS